MVSIIRRISKIAPALLGALIISALPVTSDDAVTGREIASKWENAIVRVQVVIKSRMSVEGRESGSYENKAEGTGTVVDPSGLTLIPLSVTNPAEAFGLEDDEGYNFKTELGDIKIRLRDGKEIPAIVVLRDKDLDIALIRPKQKQSTPFACVNLEESSLPQVLDDLVLLTRLGKVANQATAVSMSRIQAIVDKPRKFYVMGTSSMGDDLGGAVFSLDGKLVGVILLRTIPGEKRNFDRDNILPIIVPAADIAEVAKQAPDKPAEEPTVKPLAPVKPATPPAKVKPAK